MSAVYKGLGRGKLIVFGEHAVVYGCPAVACGLPAGARAKLSIDGNARWRVTHPTGELSIDGAIRQAGARLFEFFDLDLEKLSIDVELSIPVGAGLGSSAALSVALARAAASMLGLGEDEREARIQAAVAASEAVFHGQASGIDQQASMSEGFFVFQRQNQAVNLTTFEAPPHLWLVAKVAPTASTSELVAEVARRRAQNRPGFDKLFQQFASIAKEGAKALETGDFATVGRLMTCNQELLKAIGVSSPALEAACSAAHQAGALGAKLTGAGGGGCIVALPGNDPAPVIQALKEHGQVFEFTLPTDDLTFTAD